MKGLSISDSTNSLDAVGEIPIEAPEARRWSVPPNKKYSNSQPLWHLILLDFITFGLYFFYWSYTNWKHLKEYKKLDINPGKKTLFLLIPIFGFALVWGQFVAFRDFSREAGARISFNPNWVMAGFLVFNISFKLPDPYWLLGFLIVVPIALVQRSLNSAWAQVEPGLRVRKLPTIGDILTVIVSWIVIGILGFILG